jgi:putative redox protein
MPSEMSISADSSSWGSVMAKEVILKQVQGITFVAKGNSSHWVVMDGSTDFGGNLAGSTPKELLLMALAGCTATDVVPILKKKRAPLQKLEINIKGNEREEHPRIFTDIHVEYVFYGDGLKAEDIERAIELSTTKYCSVSAILKASAPITHSYRIESSEITTTPAVM